jgi:hypothetical protein
MNRETYSRNQCSLLIRVDGNELEIPVNFGLTADEIRAIYPYCAKLANTKIPNPTFKFVKDVRDGFYNDMSNEEYAEVLKKIRSQSDFWYHKSEASLLELAIRFALDIQFKGISSIQDVFSTVTPFENIKVKETVSEKEAAKILKETGMETETDEEFDSGDEHDVEMGSAGDMPVDIYDSGEDTDFLSKELDAIEAAKVEDRFEKIIKDNQASDIPDKYKSKYKAKGFDEGQIGEDGLLDIYASLGSTNNIFNDEQDDGLVSEESLENKKQDSAESVSEENADKEEPIANDSEITLNDLDAGEYITDPEFEDTYDDIENNSEE